MADYQVSVDADWCRSDGRAEVMGWWVVRYDYDRWDVVWEYPYYRPAAAGQLGGVTVYSGSFPRSDGRKWYYYIYRLYGSASAALLEASSVIGQIGVTWARICAGRLTGIDGLRLPWDVEGAPDFGTAVRQRDGALVWWLARPVEALRELFVPQVPLAARLASLAGLAHERFPWSVYYALRVPPAVEVDYEVPCFDVGNRYELCPDDRVVRAVGMATRVGFGVVAMVGVVWWLGRRISPSLRI